MKIILLVLVTFALIAVIECSRPDGTKGDVKDVKRTMEKMKTKWNKEKAVAQAQGNLKKVAELEKVI
jgi:hypothetical protein